VVPTSSTDVIHRIISIYTWFSPAAVIAPGDVQDKLWFPDNTDFSTCTYTRPPYPPAPQLALNAGRLAGRVGLYVPPMDLYIKVGVAGGDWGPCGGFEKYLNRGILALGVFRLSENDRRTNVRSKGLFDSIEVMTPRRLVLDPATQLTPPVGLCRPMTFVSSGTEAEEGRIFLPAQLIGNCRSLVYVQPVEFFFPFHPSVAMSYRLSSL